VIFFYFIGGGNYDVAGNNGDANMFGNDWIGGGGTLLAHFSLHINY